MMLKKLFICCVLMFVSSSACAADNDTPSLSYTLDQQSPPSSPARIQEDFVEQQHAEQVPDAPQKASFASALGSVSCKVFSATLLLSNTFGRLALAGGLGYKAYQETLKALENDAKRNKHIIKAVCYFGAACMLLQDGYQWVLRQGAIG